MENKSFRQILSYMVSFFYYLINQLMIVDIDNNHVLFLFSAIYIHKIRNRSLCYNFTYNQMPWSINIIVNK